MMEQLLNNPFYEYLLLLSPSPQVKGEVMKIKNLYKNEYGIISAPNSKPHITLVDFCQFKSTEQTIIKSLKTISKYVQPTEIILSEFGQFNERTIYINVIENKSILNCISLIKSHLRKKLTGIKSINPAFTSHLHLTIAKNIPVSQFANVWIDWKNKAYYNSFLSIEMLLLKREIEINSLKPLSYYKPIETFSFTGENNLNQQLTLF
jgi:2'-5' RNA ligase